MRQISLHFPDADGTYTRGGSFQVDQSGQAVLSVEDESVRADLEKIAEGVGPRSLKRRVDPSEGDLFLDAVLEQFANSSYVRVVDEGLIQP
jgi:hypothetical protein